MMCALFVADLSSVSWMDKRPVARNVFPFAGAGAKSSFSQWAGTVAKVMAVSSSVVSDGSDPVRETADSLRQNMPAAPQI
ncbi:hypothetical protein N7E02_24395 [Aliirhizobium terrae]|uniref:hypothetical protein n=1 Tax=Terrirhizobium terrae TaxID=2926709 RepID=UPI002576C5DE|nr:hypothetical protein [Rhizobium sp. CC-CFT758]WJH39831.1 hypothetical protein N7E02_24395 [Rhizobium sp. CC-CFT758]